MTVIKSSSLNLLFSSAIASKSNSSSDVSPVSSTVFDLAFSFFKIASNCLKFKGFPFKGKFSNETVQKQKVCDENGICKLTLKVGTTYHISVLKPDDSFSSDLAVALLFAPNDLCAFIAMMLF